MILGGGGEACRVSPQSMDDHTPFEDWYGKKPHVGHLRVFGCTAHAKVTTPHLKKLDDQSHMMVYLGVEDGSKAHRLYDPRQNKIHVSRELKKIGSGIGMQVQ